MIPLNQTTWLKHPVFFSRSSLKPIITNYRGSVAPDSARKRRSAGDFDDEKHDEDMIDLLKLYERHAKAKSMKKEYSSSLDYEFLEVRKHVAMSYGKFHKVRASDWRMMRGNKR